jgi:hypothetical protein
MAHCLERGGAHAEHKHIQLLNDCAEMCRLSESFMLRGSGYAKKVCELCAEVCDKCAASCEKVDADDEHMKLCAEACRKCAAACRAMIKG